MHKPTAYGLTHRRKDSADHQFKVFITLQAGGGLDQFAPVAKVSGIFYSEIF